MILENDSRCMVGGCKKEANKSVTLRSLNNGHRMKWKVCSDHAKYPGDWLDTAHWEIENNNLLSASERRRLNAVEGARRYGNQESDAQEHREELYGNAVTCDSCGAAINPGEQKNFKGEKLCEHCYTVETK